MNRTRLSGHRRRARPDSPVPTLAKIEALLLDALALASPKECAAIAGRLVSVAKELELAREREAARRAAARTAETAQAEKTRLQRAIADLRLEIGPESDELEDWELEEGARYMLHCEARRRHAAANDADEGPKADPAGGIPHPERAAGGAPGNVSCSPSAAVTHAISLPCGEGDRIVPPVNRTRPKQRGGANASAPSAPPPQGGGPRIRIL